MMKRQVAADFAARLTDMLDAVIPPAYMNEGKYHLNIAFGRTGGQHRNGYLWQIIWRKYFGKRVIV